MELTPEQIQDIEIAVMGTYPYTDKERTCWQHKERIAFLRNRLRQKLITHIEQENSIGTSPQGNEQNGAALH